MAKKTDDTPTSATADGSSDPIVLDDRAPLHTAPRGDGGLGLRLNRYFTTEGVHPYDEIEWELRDAVIKNWRDGSISFEQRGVEFPTTWSMNATTIVAQKYFRGQLGTPERERSVRQIVDRVADTITAWGLKDGYFADAESAEIYNAELKHLLVTQKAAFNSPVWFNIGVPGVPQQASACFILSVEDTMSSILNWYREEGTIFKGGSGAGVNLSAIRSSKEPLQGGGSASGPVSFMRGADASAGTIKSGGKCFRQGTLVGTPSGLVPIESLKVGDVVLTHAGARRVADFMPNGVKQCFLVRTKEGYEVEVTTGHKFAYWDREAGDYAVKPIEEFAPGDALHVLVEPSLDGEDVPLVAPATERRPHETTTCEMVFPTQMSPELAYMLGLFYGDGEVRTEYPYRVRVAFAKDDAGYLSAERFRKFGRHVFGEEPIELGDYAGYQVLGYTRKRLVEFLSANGIAKGKAEALDFPPSLFRAHPEIRAAFIAGYIDADGTFAARGGWSISSIDRAFLVEIQRLLLSLGVASKIKLSRAARGNWQALYRLKVVGATFVDLLNGWIRPYSAKAEHNPDVSDGADKGWGYRPSLYRDLRDRARSGGTLLERTVGAANATTGYGAIRRLIDHPDDDVATYAAKLSRTVQVTLESVEPTVEDQTYDIEVEGAHLLCANGIYASNTRRAAKMVILNVDHPDVEDFIWCKASEERKARVLREAGFDMDLDGADSHSIQYQNANNSVRVTDEFMKAYEEETDYELRAVTTGEALEQRSARDVMRQIAEAAWECADPGMQYDTTINDWHTAPESGRINGSNPCSEYMHLDNSACNLASLNLKKFYDYEAGRFDVEAFKRAVEVVFLGQEILVGNSSYPTEKIGENARAFRELGLGYANLGGLLMSIGLPYDSDEGRAWAGAITALMTGHAYRSSAEFARVVGVFDGYKKNEKPMLRVIGKHRDAVDDIDPRRVPEDLLDAARTAWDEALALGERHGYRNSQASVLAPTGCLVGGTLVPTERGLVRLASLGDPAGEQWQDLGVDVATDEGVREASKFYVNGLESVVTVNTGRGYRIQGTPKHRIKVVQPDGTWAWKRFGDIAPGDRVPLSLDQLVGEPQRVSLPPLGEGYWTGERHAVAPREVTPQLAELVGYFMGDGSLHARGIRLCVAAEDWDVIERLKALGKELFNLEAHVTEQGGYTEVAFHSVRLVEWWEAVGFAKHEPQPGHSGKGWEPHIPDAILHTNDRAVYAAFVRGLFEADGTVAGGGYPSWSTTSLQLSHDVQSLLLAMGYPTTRKMDRTGWGDSDLAVLRILNSAYNEPWLEEVGFISDRKSAGVAIKASRQSARYDHIPVTRELIDRVAPDNGRFRQLLLMGLSRTASVSRRLAGEVFDATADAELGHLVGFFYDEVVSAELGEDELTYDLSVPDNVTYIANGFVSHNTIGLMMDCDTTGIEPDLALVKTKKLVGGGSMQIVNQSIPAALEHLGYNTEQAEAIIAHIDEHKTIDGAPALREEHRAVFQCAMGDNAIHYMGHVKMMAAAQPFLSGAISKTVNVPEEATVEDVEQLFYEGWKLGLKAIAIYRDNCKVGQPLSVTKKAGAAAGETGGIQVKDGMIRRKLPKQRPSQTISFQVGDAKGYLTAGEYPGDGLGEIFLKLGKQGSTLSGVMDAFAISVSLGLQYGVPLDAYIEKFMNMRFEPAGMTDDPDVRFATSIVDYIARKLAIEYLPADKRAALGIATTSERTEALDAGGYGDSAEAAVPETATELPQAPAPANRVDVDAPMCFSCGIKMKRAGACHVCESCGTTSGCS